jgi:hypothetical protein
MGNRTAIGSFGALAIPLTRIGTAAPAARSFGADMRASREGQNLPCHPGMRSGGSLYACAAHPNVAFREAAPGPMQPGARLRSGGPVDRPLPPAPAIPAANASAAPDRQSCCNQEREMHA